MFERYFSCPRQRVRYFCLFVKSICVSTELVQGYPASCLRKVGLLRSFNTVLA